MEILLSINVYSSLVSGFLLSIVRATEPVFWHRIKVSVHEFFGEMYGDKNEEVRTPLMQFLMSSLNIELTNIILQTVSSKTVG